jgi:hypothetical protein
MRRVLVVSMLLSLATGAFALPFGPWSRGPWMGTDPTLNAEVASILDQNAQAQLGTMTVQDLTKIAGEISIAMQKDQYIRSAGMASMILPGVGQFKSGDTTGGVLFLTGDLVIFAGTVLGAYFLLPANVQFGSIDYLNTPLSSIKTTWDSNTLSNYLPSIAVVVGGMAAEMLLRWISARNAEDQARSAIASGKVTFQPQLVPLFGLVGPGGKPGFGFGMRWH